MAGPDIKAKANINSFMKQTKSQVTLIMIVGIVILIVAVLFIYISKNSGKKIRESSIKEVHETALEMQPIKELVSGCLDKLAKDSVVLIGRQGGYIYESQGGSFVDFQETDEGVFFISNDKSNVAYNIKNIPIQTPNPYSSSIPSYPWQTFPYEPGGNKNFKGVFGQNGMPPLNKEGGPHSIQEQIETYIDNNLDKCLDLSTFNSQGYDIKKSRSKTTVLLGSTDVTIQSEIPIEALNPNTKETLQIKDFSTKLDVRMKDAYYFINNLVENDIKDITFNLTSTSNNKNSFNVRAAENAFGNDDIVIINDENSLIYGQPFEYIFARKNRAPALYHISKSTLEFQPNHAITQQDILRDSEFKAEDPDEDNIILTIKAELTDPNLPTILNHPQITFKVEVNDGALSDHQIITVNRI